MNPITCNNDRLNKLCKCKCILLIFVLFVFTGCAPRGGGCHQNGRGRHSSEHHQHHLLLLHCHPGAPLCPWLHFENPIFQERYFNIYNTCWIHQRPLVDSVLQEFGVLDSIERYLSYAPWRRLFHIDDAE